jgi:hypothetical protein
MAHSVSFIENGTGSTDSTGRLFDYSQINLNGRHEFTLCQESPSRWNAERCRGPLLVVLGLTLITLSTLMIASARLVAGTGAVLVVAGVGDFLLRRRLRRVTLSIDSAGIGAQNGFHRFAAPWHQVQSWTLGKEGSSESSFSLRANGTEQAWVIPDRYLDSLDRRVLRRVMRAFAGAKEILPASPADSTTPTPTITTMPKSLLRPPANQHSFAT